MGLPSESVLIEEKSENWTPSQLEGDGDEEGPAKEIGKEWPLREEEKQESVVSKKPGSLGGEIAWVKFCW